MKGDGDPLYKFLVIDISAKSGKNTAIGSPQKWFIRSAEQPKEICGLSSERSSVRGPR
jgi:hypothetical protein